MIHLGDVILVNDRPAVSDLRGTMEFAGLALTCAGT